MQILQGLEDEKQKKIDRAARFGTEIPLVKNQQKMARLERFKGASDQNNGAQGAAPADDGDEKAKKEARMARFGPAQTSTDKVENPKVNRGALEFTLDEYKIKNKENKFGNRQKQGGGGFKKNKFNKQNNFKNKNHQGGGKKRFNPKK